MAIIPLAPQQQILTPNAPVPVRGSGVAGIADAATAEVGGDIQKLGVSLMQHYQKQQDMQQSNQYEIGASQIEMASTQSYEEAKRTAKPDGSDFNDVYNKLLDPKIEDIKSNGPQTGAYADKLATTAEVVRNHMNARGTVEAASMLEKQNAQDVGTIGDTFADSVRENPTPEMVDLRTKSYGDYLDDKVNKGIFTADTKQKLMSGFSEKLGISYVEGLANKGSYGQAVNALRANQPDPTMMTKLDPDQAHSLGLITQKEADQLRDSGSTYDIPVLQKKDGSQLSPAGVNAINSIDPLKKNALIDQFKGKAEAANSLRLSELNSNVNGLEFLAYNGGDISDKQIADVKSQINMNSSLTPFARVRLMDAVNTASATNGAIKAMQSAPRSQWGGIVDGFDGRVQGANDHAATFDPQMAGAGADVSVQANRLQAKSHLQAYAAKLAKSQSDDAGQFAVESDQTLSDMYNGTKDGDPGAAQKFARQTMARQGYLQIPSEDRSILPNQDARNLGAALKNAQSSENADDFIHGLQQKWGPYYPQVFNEIADSDKSLKKYSAITYAPAATRFDLVDAIKNQDVINKSFENMPDKKITKEAVSSAVEAKLRPFSQAIAGGSNDISNMGIVNNFHDAMALQVKRAFLQGNTDVSDATDKAFNDLIGSQFNVIQNRNSAIIAPKLYQGQPLLPEQVQAYVGANSQVDGLKTLGLQIPKDPTGKYERNPESFYTDLEKTGKWVTNRDQSGIKLMNVNMDGSLTPIYDKYGKPVEKTYGQVQKAPQSFGTSAFDKINQINKFGGK